MAKVGTLRELELEQEVGANGEAVEFLAVAADEDDDDDLDVDVDEEAVE